MGDPVGGMNGGGVGKRAVTAGAGTGKRAVGSSSGGAGAGAGAGGLAGSRTLSSSGTRFGWSGSLDGSSSSSPTPINLDSLYLWDPFLAPGSITFDSLRQHLPSSPSAAVGGTKSRKSSSAATPRKITPGSSQKGSHRKPSTALSSRKGSFHHSGKDSDAHMAKALKEAEDLAQKALAVMTAAQNAKDAETGGGKGGRDDIRGSRTSMSRTSMRASFAKGDTVKNDLRQVELLTRRLIIFSKEGEDLSDHKPSVWAVGEEESNEEDDDIFNSNANVGEDGGDEDQGGQGMVKGNSRMNLLTKLTREASSSLESIFAKALDDGDDPDDEDEEDEAKGGKGHLDTSQRAKDRRKQDPTNQYMWLQIVYYPGTIKVTHSILSFHIAYLNPFHQFTLLDLIPSPPALSTTPRNPCLATPSQMTASPSPSDWFLPTYPWHSPPPPRTSRWMNMVYP